MYTWIEEGTYDQEYLDTHCVGFDADHMPEGHDSKENLKDYILGTYDGIPKVLNGLRRYVAYLSGLSSFSP